MRKMIQAIWHGVIRKTQMHRFANWLLREFLEILPIWLFFLFAFGMLALTQSVLLAEYGLQKIASPEYFVGSLIVAKVVLIADLFRAVSRFDGRPLIYGTLWKTTIYLPGALAIRHIEEMIHLMRRHRGFVQANTELFHLMARPRFWLLVAWLAVLIFAFCATRELFRRLGEGRFMMLFFGYSPHGIQTDEDGKHHKRAA